jgi:hypothetical protein
MNSSPLAHDCDHQAHQLGHRPLILEICAERTNGRHLSSSHGILSKFERRPRPPTVPLLRAAATVLCKYKSIAHRAGPGFQVHWAKVCTEYLTNPPANSCFTVTEFSSTKSIQYLTN